MAYGGQKRPFPMFERPSTQSNDFSDDSLLGFSDQQYHSFNKLQRRDGRGSGPQTRGAGRGGGRGDGRGDGGMSDLAYSSLRKIQMLANTDADEFGDYNTRGGFGGVDYSVDDVGYGGAASASRGFQGGGQGRGRGIPAPVSAPHGRGSTHAAPFRPTSYRASKTDIQNPESRFEPPMSIPFEDDNVEFDQGVEFEQDFDDMVGGWPRGGPGAAARGKGRGRSFEAQGRGFEPRGRGFEARGGRGYEPRERGFGQDRGRGFEQPRSRGGRGRGDMDSGINWDDSSWQHAANIVPMGAARGGRGGVRGQRGMRGRGDMRFAAPGSMYENELDAFEHGPRLHQDFLRNKPRYERGTTAYNIHGIAEFMKQMPKKDNDIQNLENAMTGSKINVRPAYTSEMLQFYSNASMFTGALYLGDAFLARGVGKNKKDTKHETYRIAYEVLTRKTVEDVLLLKDPGVDMVRIELLKNFGEETTGFLSGECTPQQAALVAELERVQNNIMCYGTYTENPISSVELHLKRPGILISASFNLETVTVEKGHYFIGELLFNDILIATGEGMSKKTAKTATYQKALEYLKTKSPQELARGGGINAHVQASSSSQKPNQKNKAPDLTFENTKIVEDSTPENLTSQLTVVIKKVREAQPPDNYTSMLDSILVQARLATVVLLKSKEILEDGQISAVPGNAFLDGGNANTNQPCFATLYVNCIKITEADGKNKKEAQEECYKDAWEIFRKETVSDLIHKYDHIDPMEDTSRNLIDIMVKGKGKFGDSNLERLIKMNSDVFQKWRPLSDLIIIETPELITNRKQNAFSILNNSATFCGMLLEWTFDRRNTQKSTMAAGCFVRLQREIIGQAVMRSKNEARNEACLNAMRKYYFSQTVLMKLPLTDEDIKYSVSWDQLHEEVATWNPDPQQLAENMMKVDCTVAYTKEFRESALFQYILHLSRMAEEKMVGSLVLGVDFPDDFKRMLYVIMDRKGWRLESKKTTDGSYMLINRLRDIREIAALLEKDTTRKSIVNQHRVVDPTTISSDFW